MSVFGSFPGGSGQSGQFLQSNRSMFYGDSCDTHLVHDSPSVRKTHWGGRKHKETVKAYCQNRIWSTKQPQHFNKERYLLLCSLLLLPLLQGQWSWLPQVSWVLLTRVWCQYPIWRALPWCQRWALLPLGRCQWEWLLEWGCLLEAVCL